MNGSKDIDIVGAGLAGMTAALRLRQLGYAVTLHESSEFLGGQAGSRLSRGRWQDHGYHVVFPWYLNMRAMMAELGIIPKDAARTIWEKGRNATFDVDRIDAIEEYPA